MEKIEIGFVILTYRNFNDLQEIIPSIENAYSSFIFKILIVNSFYDEMTKNRINKIANKYGCDFINVENKGYGYGNNRGIEYFLLNYKFDYLVIANPDTIVQKNKFDYRKYKNDTVVIAPCIKNLNGKYQNPYWVINNPIAEYFIYLGHKYKKKFILYLGIGINKIIRAIFYLKRNNSFRTIFACHGSYIIFSKKALDRIRLPYDEHMFLFAEENLLAHVLKKHEIPVIYTNNIEILHKEDGSMNVAKIDENKELSKSIIYYYEKLKKVKNKL